MIMRSPGTSPAIFAILSALVEERLGLHYPLSDADLLASKVASRASEAGFDSLLDYYYHLRYDDPDGREFDALAEVLVVQESYLFREVAQLEALVDLELVPRVRAGRRPRVWSAACAHGEEPFSLAMMLAERGVLDEVEIVASDVSSRALDRAREGFVPGRALRNPELAARAERWLVREGRDARIGPRVRAAVDFRRVNLLDDAEVAALGSFDAILCRNVLIYFSDDRVRQVVARLTARLLPGGTLWVGVSESLLRFGTPLLCEERQGVFAYRRPVA